MNEEKDMKFKVPRYIEHKAKIVGPADFQQVLYMGAAGVIIFFLYFTIRHLSSALFVLLSFIIGISSVALAFFNVRGQSLPEYIKKFVFFSTSSRTYIWKKKNMLFKMTTSTKTTPKKITPIKEEDDKKKPKGKSKLRDISTRIETS